MSTDYSSEMLFLTNLQLDSISAELLESDLTNSLEEIHSQIKATKILQVAWQHHIDEKIVDEAPAGEQVLLIDRFLRTAPITREAMLRWTQRFLMIDAIFQMRTDTGHVPAKKKGMVREWNGS
ncbi:hypothetical protein GCK32_009399 [Trichostrongylus colubriformis]|uniref:Uncharacterized protein n=1 Tax=Trichostrongylus colubriformis TaxID=6319 RepID=A0AAN8FV48_TRICO